MAKHLERIEMLKMIQNELVENYKKEQIPNKKANILMQLAELQQYLSSFFDSTRYVMEQAAKIKQEPEQQGSILNKKKKKKLRDLMNDTHYLASGEKPNNATSKYADIPKTFIDDYNEKRKKNSEEADN